MISAVPVRVHLPAFSYKLIKLHLSHCPVNARQGISEGYLEQLVSLLKKAGLVKSIRGAGGGYILARAMDDISVGDIFNS